MLSLRYEYQAHVNILPEFLSSPFNMLAERHAVDCLKGFLNFFIVISDIDQTFDCQNISRQ